MITIILFHFTLASPSSAFLNPQIINQDAKVKIVLRANVVTKKTCIQIN
jgi:hypothetical protein